MNTCEYGHGMLHSNFFIGCKGEGRVNVESKNGQYL